MQPLSNHLEPPLNCGFGQLSVGALSGCTDQLGLLSDNERTPRPPPGAAELVIWKGCRSCPSKPSQIISKMAVSPPAELSLPPNTGCVLAQPLVQ